MCFVVFGVCFFIGGDWEGKWDSEICAYTLKKLVAALSYWITYPHDNVTIGVGLLLVNRTMSPSVSVCYPQTRQCHHRCGSPTRKQDNVTIGVGLLPASRTMSPSVWAGYPQTGQCHHRGGSVTRKQDNVTIGVDLLPANRTMSPSVWACSRRARSDCLIVTTVWRCDSDYSASRSNES
jgi:hypothetical protein